MCQADSCSGNMIGGIKERTNSNRNPPSAPTPGRSTGFPKAEHRSKKSAFLQNRQQLNSESVVADQSPSISLTQASPQTIASSSNQGAGQSSTPDGKIRDDVSVQNAQQVDSMTDEQIEQERQDIFARFGPGIAERLRRAREAQSRQSTAGERVHIKSS